MTEREALKLALEALEQLQGGCTDSDDGTVEAITVWCPEVIDAIKEALAQPEQEPVAHTLNCVCGAVWDIKADGSEEMVHTPNTTPPQRTWVGLTPEEVEACIHHVDEDGIGLFDFAEAIEAKLKQKNGYAEEKNT